MEWGDAAAESKLVVKVAWLFPATGVKVPLPSGVDPSKNVTKPVAVPVAAVTVAVNVTVSPRVIVAALGLTAVDVAVEDCGAGSRGSFAARGPPAIAANKVEMSRQVGTLR
jgi:hypothetical protein